MSGKKLSLAAEAYLYGYPLVYCVQEMINTASKPEIAWSAPGPDKESNWLPAPKGDFRPILRMYQPRPEALDGTYVLPPIRRVG